VLLLFCRPEWVHQLHLLQPCLLHQQVIPPAHLQMLVGLYLVWAAVLQSLLQAVLCLEEYHLLLERRLLAQTALLQMPLLTAVRLHQDLHPFEMSAWHMTLSYCHLQEHLLVDCLRSALACQALHWPEPNLQQPSKQSVCQCVATTLEMHA